MQQIILENKGNIVAITKTIRVPEELIEEAETIAISLTATENALITKNDVIRRALKIGYKQLKTGNHKIRNKKKE